MLAMEWLNRFTAREEVAETCQKVAEIGREAISKPMERSPAVRGDVVIGTAPIAVMTIGDTTTVMIDPEHRIVPPSRATPCQSEHVAHAQSSATPLPIHSRTAPTAHESSPGILADHSSPHQRAPIGWASDRLGIDTR